MKRDTAAIKMGTYQDVVMITDKVTLRSDVSCLPGQTSWLKVKVIGKHDSKKSVYQI